jgi:hypothetical protein
LILFCIAFFALLSLFQQSPPRAVPSSAPSSEFSSERALRHLQAIAQKPHPIGSREHDAVRDYIVSELKSLGLDPQVQETTAVNNMWGAPYRTGTVQNIAARLNGTGGGKAILLAGHYDSVITGPGASDAGSAVVALLEIARALREGPPLKNDVIFLFTDGEEMGLLGAIAFTQEHPWMKDVRLALNFEARGHSGPSIMFETTSNNGWLIDEFGKTVEHPIATSFAYEIYRRLPNNTDFTAFKKADLQGLNFAYINGLTHYHTRLDNLETIDQRSIQHHGSYALPLTRHFGNIDLENRRTGNAVYFDLFGSALIRYSQVWVIPNVVIITLLFAGVVLLGLRRKLISPGKILFAFFALLICLAAAVLLTTVAWRAIEMLHPGYRHMTMGVTYNGKLYTMSFLLLTIGVMCALLIWFRKWISLESLAIGASLWWLILSWAASVLIPGASYLFVWPLLFSLTGIACGFLIEEREYASVRLAIVLALTAIPAIVILVPAMYEISVALPLMLSGVVTFMAALTIGLLIPQIGVLMSRARWLIPAVSIAGALILVIAAASTSGFSKERPKPNNIFYALDGETGKATWGSFDARPDEWTSQFLSTSYDRGPLPEFFPLISRDFIKSQAAATAIPAPEAALVEDRMNGDVRSLRLRVTSSRQAPFIAVYLDEGAGILKTSVNGKPINTDGVAADDESPWGMYYYNPPREGIELALEVNSQKPVNLRVVDLSFGLPSVLTESLQPRPDYMMPLPVTFSDATLVSKSFTFNSGM